MANKLGVFMVSLVLVTPVVQAGSFDESWKAQVAELAKKLEEAKAKAAK